MKKNSWKTLLSVVLLLTMLVSMLPFAAFAEDGQTAAAQTEEAAKTDEKTGDAPEGGTGGGTIVCTGTPEQVAKHPTSYTARFLKPLLERAGKQL